MKFCICSAVLLAIVTFTAAQTNTRRTLFNCNNPGNNCFGSSTCNPTTGLCTCVVGSGYEGEDCSIISANRCSTLSCSNNGLCERVTGTPRCRCYAGYTGTNCQISPMTCQCSATDMTISMKPPGDFSNGDGYVKGYRNVGVCSTQQTFDFKHEFTIAHASSSCDSLARTNLQANGEYTYSRTFYFRYIRQLLTNHGIEFTCNCVFSPTNQVLYATISNIVDSPNNLIKVNATGYNAPVTYSMSKDGAIITRSTLIRIGDQILLTILADAGYCVMIDTITVNNTMTGSLYREATLLQNRCRTSVGRSVIQSELQADSIFQRWTTIFSAFLLDNSNNIILTIRYRAYPSVSQCSLPSCSGTGRKKRQATSENRTAETAGTFQQIIIINEPESPTRQINLAQEEECSMSSKVMIGLIVMAAVICVLLIVCFVVGLRMIMAKKRNQKAPPAYVN